MFPKLEIWLFLGMELDSKSQAHGIVAEKKASSDFLSKIVSLTCFSLFLLL